MTFPRFLFPPALAAMCLGASAADKPRVIASTTLIADVARQVAGDAAAVESLTGAEADPHAFDPRPAQVRALLDADLVLVNGAGLETGLLRALKDAGGRARVVEVSKGVALRSGGAACDHGDGEHDHEHDHADDAPDPHVWFNPLLVKAWADNIAAALAEAQPAQRERFTANAAAYREELDRLDAWIRERLAAVPEERRVLVSDHAFLGYFADRYGFRVEASLLPGNSTLAQPSARALGEVVRTLRAKRIPAIFVEAGSSHRLADRIGAEAGARVAPLRSCSLGPPGSGADTYLGFMRANTEAVREALTDGKP